MQEMSQHSRTRALGVALVALLLVATGCVEGPPPAQTYTVQAGDSFYRIAQKTGVDAAELVALNGLTFNSYIFPGDVLTLPAGATSVGAPSPPTTTTPPTPSASSFGQRLATEAQRHVGKRYVWGTSGPSTFDCSGLIVYSYARAGRTIPRYASWMMADRATRVSPSNMAVGDLVFFYSPVSHVGIYLGNDRFVHAANSRTGVITSKLSTYRAPWFAGRL